MFQPVHGHNAASAALVKIGVALLAAVAFVTCTLCFAAKGEVAHAQDDVDADKEKAKAVFLEGRKAYQEKDFATAITRFKEAYRIKPNNKLLIYIARAYDQSGKVSDALDYLQKYASTSPEAAEYIKEELAALRKSSQRLALKYASSEVEQAVAIATPGGKRVVKAKLELEIAPTFSQVPYAITSEPAGADVFVDDKEFGSLGKTPLTIDLFSGRHTIWLERPYHESQSVEVHVRPVKGNSSGQNLKMQLQRQMVPVEIRTMPQNAEIILIKDNGESLTLGKGKYSGRLPAGETKFVLKATGLGQLEFDEVILLSEVKENGAVNLDFDMRDSSAIRRDELSTVGTLEITGYLIEAEILINNKVVGKTPRFTTNLAPGPHAVEIRKEGFISIHKVVRIEPGQTHTIETPETLQVTDSGVNWGGWLTLTAGLAVAGGGGFFTFQQLETQKELDNLGTVAPSDMGQPAKERREKILSLEEEADQQALISYILYGIGGAGVVTGIVLLAVGGKDTRVVEREGAPDAEPYEFALDPIWGVDQVGLSLSLTLP